MKLTRRGWFAALVGMVAAKKAPAMLKAGDHIPVKLTAGPLHYMGFPFRADLYYDRNRMDFLPSYPLRITYIDHQNKSVTLEPYTGIVRKETMTEAHLRARQQRVMDRWEAKHSTN